MFQLCVSGTGVEVLSSSGKPKFKAPYAANMQVRERERGPCTRIAKKVWQRRDQDIFPPLSHLAELRGLSPSLLCHHCPLQVCGARGGGDAASHGVYLCLQPNLALMLVRSVLSPLPLLRGHSPPYLFTLLRRPLTPARGGECVRDPFKPAPLCVPLPLSPRPARTHMTATSASCSSGGLRARSESSLAAPRTTSQCRPRHRVEQPRRDEHAAMSTQPTIGAAGH